MAELLSTSGGTIGGAGDGTWDAHGADSSDDGSHGDGDDGYAARRSHPPSVVATLPREPITTVEESSP